MRIRFAETIPNNVSHYAFSTARMFLNTNINMICYYFCASQNIEKSLVNFIEWTLFVLFEQFTLFFTHDWCQVFRLLSSYFLFFFVKERKSHIIGMQMIEECYFGYDFRILNTYVFMFFSLSQIAHTTLLYFIFTHKFVVFQSIVNKRVKNDFHKIFACKVETNCTTNGMQYGLSFLKCIKNQKFQAHIHNKAIS